MGETRGYTIEASGFADDLVRYYGVLADSATGYSRGLTKAEAERQAKNCARELMATRRECGRVTVRHEGRVVKSLTLRAGKWVA